jgi:hypothetical protein
MVASIILGASAMCAGRSMANMHVFVRVRIVAAKKASTIQNVVAHSVLGNKATIMHLANAPFVIAWDRIRSESL